MATGIPFLVVGFYIFIRVGSWKRAVLVNAGVILYVINVFRSSFKQTRSVHSWYMIIASMWLFSTTFSGCCWYAISMKIFYPGIRVLSFYTCTFRYSGLVPLLVIGVGSRLIPMFLISKYTNNKTLWWILGLINAGLASFIIFKILEISAAYYYISLILVLSAIVLFGRHCIKAYKVRIRKNVDEQMKTSLLSVIQMLLPFIALITVLAFLPADSHPNIDLLYGFCIFFGWITEIILGVTFKTLPFIVWNKVYHKKHTQARLLHPKSCSMKKYNNSMLVVYLSVWFVYRWNYFHEPAYSKIRSCGIIYNGCIICF